jgi:pimeloyl-ACP methyl ester carboxylesterase
VGRTGGGAAVGIPTLVITPQARHLANVEQPEEVTQAMLAHLGPLTERQENL